MVKTYVIWWHSTFIDEINREAITIAEIVDTTSRTIKHLQELQKLEAHGQIKVKTTESLNPIYLEIIDPAVEPQVANNPLVEILYE